MKGYEKIALSCIIIGSIAAFNHKSLLFACFGGIVAISAFIVFTIDWIWEEKK